MKTANLQMFLTELCTLLGLSQPEPPRAERSDNASIFERQLATGSTMHAGTDMSDAYNPSKQVNNHYPGCNKLFRRFNVSVHGILVA